MLYLTPFLRRPRQRSGCCLMTARQGTRRPCPHLCSYSGTGLASLLGGGVQAAHRPGATSTVDGRGASTAPGTLRMWAALSFTPQRVLLFSALWVWTMVQISHGTVRELRSDVGIQGSGVIAPHSAASHMMGQTTSVLWQAVLTSQLFCWSTHFSYSWTFYKYYVTWKP